MLALAEITTTGATGATSELPVILIEIGLEWPQQVT